MLKLLAGISIILLAILEYSYIMCMENSPNITLSKVVFHTVDNYTEEMQKNENEISYLLPKTFKRLIFNCSASYPISWKFAVPPFKDEKLKDFSVEKFRYVLNFEDKTTYTYVARLDLNFKDQNSITNISCRGAKHSGRETNSTMIVSNTPREKPFHVRVKIIKGSDAEIFRTGVLNRAGINPHCNVTLNLDIKNRKFFCGTIDGRNSRPKIVHCNNPDECNSVFVRDLKSKCNSTFNNYCSENCSELNPHSSPGVIICYDDSNNSIARRYLVTQSQNDKKLQYHLGNDDDFDNETIHTSCNQSEIFFDQIVAFTCLGTGAYYSHGFQWTITTSNGTNIYLGCGKDVYDVELQIYNVTKLILFKKEYGHNVSIKCYGPKWSTSDWVPTTIPIVVNVKDISKPKITDDSYGECVKGNWTWNGYSTNFTCYAEGAPIPDMAWLLETVDGKKIINNGSASDGSDFIIVSNNVIDKTLESTISYRFKLTDKHIITCTATNFVGSATKKFKCFNSSVDSQESKNSTALVVALALVSVALVVSVFGGIYFIKRYRRKFQLSEAEIHEFENGDPKAESESALLLPYNMGYEIPRADILIETHILGEGQYGMVVLGRYKSEKVAVKTVKRSIDLRYFKALLSEIKIMCYVSDHPHLVNLIGACTRDIRKKDVLVVTEYCSNGNITKFLRKSRGCFIDLFHFNNTEKQKQLLSIENNFKKENKRASTNCITTINLLMWAYQCACGMQYLASKKVIHGDLAARNVLLTENLHAKIGDFGLSKQLFDYSIYVQKLDCPLPLKWMAIESLQDLEFSIQSDVWSYGVVLWELFSLGQAPYPGIPQWNFQSYKLLQDGYRMEAPEFCTKSIYQIMKECWNSNPKSRPSFTLLEEFFLREIMELRNS